MDGSHLAQIPAFSLAANALYLTQGTYFQSESVIQLEQKLGHPPFRFGMMPIERSKFAMNLHLTVAVNSA